MEVGIRQGVCNNSPAEATSSENGWRWSVVPILGRRRHSGARPGGSRQASTSRMARRCASKGRSRDRLEPPSVQILVVVANTQVRPLRTNVEKGSM